MSKKGNKRSIDAIKVNLSLPERIIGALLGLPRLARILIVAGFGLATTAALFPLIDRIYLTNFFSEQTTVVPSLVSAGAGIIMYVAGWILLVGTRSSQPPRRPAILLYTVFGIIIVLYVIVLVVNGYSTATAPDA